MSLSSKAERSLLGHDDWEVVKQTHHPAIHDLSRAELDDLLHRLRVLRSRERTLLRQTARGARGKARPRGGSFPGNVEHPARRKQVFASAVRRVNSEFSRLKQLEAKDALIAAAHRAWSLRSSAGSFERPANEATANEGIRSKPNRRRRSHIPGSQIGSVSQANKTAQARRDMRSET